MIGIPPDAEVNQLIVVPALEVAEANNGTIEASAHFVAVPELVGAAGAGLMVSVTFVRGLALAQLPLYVSP
jgi:hypothetical protein